MYVVNCATIPQSIHGFLLTDMRRTKEDAQQTREALLDAAELLFAQRGVSRTSLQDIAKAAGMTRGAVYWHFKDKSELFNAMMERTASPMEESLQALAHTEQSPLAELRRSAHDALHRIAHAPRTRRVFDIAHQKVEYVDDLLGIRDHHQDIHRSCQQHLLTALSKAQAQGELPEALDIRIATLSYQAMLNGLIHEWLLTPDSFDLVETGLKCIDLFFAGWRQAGATKPSVASSSPPSASR